MAAFVDTSALYAVLYSHDLFHVRATAEWQRLIGSDERLVSHNYVLLEASALLQGRIGTDAVRALSERLVPAMEVHWIDRDDHDVAIAEVAASGSRDVSVVDRVSFRLMRRLGIKRALAFDPHFADEGFELVG